MPTLNEIRDQVRELIRVKEFPLNTQRALWRGMIEFGEASDIYLKTGLEGYWNKKTHKAVSLEDIRNGIGRNGTGLDPDIVPAHDAYLEELIDVIFFVVNATHLECALADLDKVFDDKLAYNFTRPKQYGISKLIKAEVKDKTGSLPLRTFPVVKRKTEKLSGRELKSIAFSETPEPKDLDEAADWRRRNSWGEHNGA